MDEVDGLGLSSAQPLGIGRTGKGGSRQLVDVDGVARYVEVEF